MQRSCANVDGSPKRSYSTKRAAKHALRSLMTSGAKGVHIYWCAEHGYHLGH